MDKRDSSIEKKEKKRKPHKKGANRKEKGFTRLVLKGYV